MSKIRRRFISALAAATSIGGGMGFVSNVSNVACASTAVEDPGISATYALNNLVDNVKGKGGFDGSQMITSSADGGALFIPCRNGVVTVDWNTAQNIMGNYGKRIEVILNELAAAPSVKASGVLKKFDNNHINDSSVGLMPLMPKGYRNMTTVTEVAEFILKKSKSIIESQDQKQVSKDKKKALKLMKSALGDSVFNYYQGNCDPDYDFGAICCKLYDFANELENYCEKLRKLVEEDEIPLAIDTKPLSDWHYGKGFASTLFRRWGFTCVNNLVVSVLKLFTK